MTKPVAIIGMAVILPDAKNIAGYWGNILSGKDSIRDIPGNYWDIAEFYDPDPSARDKTYGFKAGVVDPIDFDSVGFGIPPAAMESISVDQLYALTAAKQALLDAGLLGKRAKPFNRDRTGVILAATVGKNAFALTRRQDIPRTKKILVNSGVPEAQAERAAQRLRDADVEWTENSEPGFLPNVTAGRIANRFDFKGTTCSVDAACASSAAALKLAIGELQSGDCDVVLTGGVNLDLSASTFISFCKTPAISKRGVSSPFDADADGMLLGDGVVIAVLKRLEDAEQSGDRIYAVIKSVGASEDGRAMSIFAPRAEGQIKAIERAFEKMEAGPAAVTLIEAHGTGTFVGDECELEALTQFYGQHGAAPNSIAIGSVKSQIGHTRMAAGAAGLVKAALALYHRTLPPTINIDKELPGLAGSPFYTLAFPKPWIKSAKYPLRTAALSSFGFGGANFHAVLEEYTGTGAETGWRRLCRIPEGICLSAADKNALIGLCESRAEDLSGNPDLYDELLDEQLHAGMIPEEYPRIGFLSVGPEDAVRKLRLAAASLRNDPRAAFAIKEESVYYRAAGLAGGAKTVTLFPGQGAQYAGMFDEIARDYPEMAVFLETVGIALEDQGLIPIADILYDGAKRNSGPRTGAAGEAARALTDTRYTQPALAAVCGGLYEILRNRGYSDDFVIGHSFGEVTGLWAGGAFDARAFAYLTIARGLAMSSAEGAGGMLAVQAGRGECERWIKPYDRLYIANENSGAQTVISGDSAEAAALAAALKNSGVTCAALGVTRAFHSPYMAKPNLLFSNALNAVPFNPLTKTLYSGADGKPYEKSAESVKETLAKQIERPVRFARCVEDAWDNGARVFVEVGPGNVLSGLVSKILDGKEFYALAVNRAAEEGSTRQFEDAIIQLRTLGLRIGGDGYRLRAPDLAGDERPKSAYQVDPIAYITPAIKARSDAAVQTVDPPPPAAPADTPVNSISEGEQIMGIGSLGASLGIQNANGLALEKFLASQNQQIRSCVEVLRDPDIAPRSNEFLKLMEIFQNNSMRAFDAYIQGQRGMLESLDGAYMPGVSRPGGDELFAPEDLTPFSQDRQEYVNHPGAPAPSYTAREAGEGPPTVKMSGTTERDNYAFDSAETGRPGPLETGLNNFDPEQAIIRIISEKTGYPAEMVDAGMDLESDLGIDSIKRIEILSELNSQIPGGLNKEDIEAIATKGTIKKIAEYIKKKEL